MPGMGVKDGEVVSKLGFSYRLCIDYMRVFLSVICEPPASEPAGSLLKIQILGPHTRPLNQNLWEQGPAICTSSSAHTPAPGQFCVHSVWFESHFLVVEGVLLFLQRLLLILFDTHCDLIWRTSWVSLFHFYWWCPWDLQRWTDLPIHQVSPFTALCLTGGLQWPHPLYK